MPSYTASNLYGGAIVVSLPEDFADVSSNREVPDNQEVYLSRSGLTSIIFDIVERADAPAHPACATDEDALKYHFEDVIAVGPTEEAIEDTKLWSTSPVVFTEIPDKPAYAMFATQHPKQAENGVSAADASASRPDFTALLLTLLRLPAQKTDILITVNVPHVRGERDYDPAQIDLAAGRAGPLLEQAFEMRDEIIKTFKILDWDLFVN